MPHYMFRWRYSGKAIHDICASPEDRSHLVKVMVEDFKGKLICFFYRLGEFHGLLIADFPNNETARACAMSAVTTKGFARFEVLPLMTAEETRETMQIAHDTQSAYYVYNSALRGGQPEEATGKDR
ncbi:GYD domain-containing protein [Acidocella aromatica]|uniref:Uncharacterized protein with GYD domain n=1 Tax=Acidocella aromatica TaxID=1303579 RepID=A0A840VND6_9PROT|nr:GYD domain-containing protein [Acidocella aromatica]MBB5371852.1 uncharacterized protein with GYD domain [Acidocella aromatica]